MTKEKVTTKHQRKLDNEGHIEFWNEHPDLEPRHGDYPSVILKDFYNHYIKQDDMYDEEMGELFWNMMERYRKAISK